jgi:hypothetical protein
MSALNAEIDASATDRAGRRKLLCAHSAHSLVNLEQLRQSKNTHLTLLNELGDLGWGHVCFWKQGLAGPPIGEMMSDTSLNCYSSSTAAAADVLGGVSRASPGSEF